MSFQARVPFPPERQATGLLPAVEPVNVRVAAGPVGDRHERRFTCLQNHETGLPGTGYWQLSGVAVETQGRGPVAKANFVVRSTPRKWPSIYAARITRPTQPFTKSSSTFELGCGDTTSQVLRMPHFSQVHPDQ